MPIPEAQLAVWAKQGSITQSARTYQAVRNALEDPKAGYRDRNFEVFLQGSYGNDTNIHAESDVDIVIRYDGAFMYDLDELPLEQQSAFDESFSNGEYPYLDFKTDVQRALETAFGDDVIPGSKVFNIAPNGTRRSADVVVAFAHRDYQSFESQTSESFAPGICFIRQDGTSIVNYPKQHSENCTAKHQSTLGAFKPLVRIFKNLRGKLVEDGLLEDGIAPSYFIEGLLYNVPDGHFSDDYEASVHACLDFLHTAPKDKFTSVNEHYFLLRDHPVCWPATHCEMFIAAAIKGWNDWT